MLISKEKKRSSLSMRIENLDLGCCPLVLIVSGCATEFSNRSNETEFLSHVLTVTVKKAPEASVIFQFH